MRRLRRQDTGHNPERDRSEAVVHVARTIADLDGTENIATHHLAEAVQYRHLD